MIEPELQRYLSGINQHLTEIKAKKSPGIWRAFFNGVFSALGYVVGLALVVVILGWILNKTGLLPAFRAQVKDFQDFMGQAKKVMSTGDSNQQTSPQAGDTYTLPDGRKVKVVP
ncbi:MAG TPA: hypothetical protein VE973_01315, partial [Candidatus Limnocylindria bacterium]|nr:hypothetical protein [Candidatus Limnocylindria bacterium]